MTTIHAYLKARGLKPTMQILDNKCPTLVKKYFKEEGVEWQLVLPNLHCNKAAKKAIGTFKEQFVTILCSCDPAFPVHLWCRLVKQATTTLNLLRQSHINPRLLTEAQLNGQFNYDKTPFTPPRTKVVLYENPEKRRTWASHGAYGWYIGNKPEHYRCPTIYVTKSRAERIARTVGFFPHSIVMPHNLSVDNAAEAARLLANALNNPAPASPFNTVRNEQMQALHKLSNIFTLAAPLPIANTVPHRILQMPTPVPPFS